MTGCSASERRFNFIFKKEAQTSVSNNCTFGSAKGLISAMNVVAMTLLGIWLNDNEVLFD